MSQHHIISSSSSSSLTSSPNNHIVRLPPIDNILSTNSSPVTYSIPQQQQQQMIPSVTNNTKRSKSRSSSQTTSNKKRQRKKFEDVKRLYYCDFANCNKGYGSLTHLNEHRVIQKHGPRKKIDDFKHIKLQQKQEKQFKKSKEMNQRSNSSSGIDKNIIKLEDNKFPIKLPPLSALPHINRLDQSPVSLPAINIHNNNSTSSVTSLSNYHYPYSISNINHSTVDNCKPRYYSPENDNNDNNSPSQIKEGSTTSSTTRSNNDGAGSHRREDMKDNTDFIIQSLLKMKNQSK